MLSFCDFIHENAWRENGRRLPVEGVYSKRDFTRAFSGYLHFDIATALSSTDPIVRGLAMLDRRTGRRRLERCRTAEQSALARSFLALRLEAEGMTDRTPVPA